MDATAYKGTHCGLELVDLARRMHTFYQSFQRDGSTWQVAIPMHH